MYTFKVAFGLDSCILNLVIVFEISAFIHAIF